MNNYLAGVLITLWKASKFIKALKIVGYWSLFQLTGNKGKLNAKHNRMPNTIGMFCIANYKELL